MSSPLHVLRSSSVPDVKGLEDIDTSQNFYLRDGRSVTAKRVLSISPRGGDVSTSIDSINSFDCKLFGNDLEHLENLYESQKQGKGIGHQARHILQLESKAKTDVDIVQKVSPNSTRPLSGGNRLSALTSTKKQLEVITHDNAADLKKLDFVYITPTNAMSHMKDGTQQALMIGGSQRHFFPSPENDALPVAAGTHTQNDQLATSEDTFSFSDATDSITSTDTKTRKRGPPASLMQRLALGSTERRKLNSNKAASSLGKPGKDKNPSVPVLVRQFSVESQQDMLTSNTASSSQSSSSSSFLARKLSSARAHPYPVSASSPTKSDSTVSPTAEVITVDTVSGLFSPSSGAVLTPVMPKGPVTYFWRDSKAALKEAQQPDIFLFVAHDNPQLGKTVAAQLSQNDLKQAAPGGGGMGCMFECKDRAVPVNTHFILGRIAFSGDYGIVEGAEEQQPRGSACIVVTDLRAVRGDIRQLSTRSRGDIVEIDLVNVPSGFSIPLNSEEDLRALLRPCVAHVDMILDPYHTSSQWFPYWEGARRMAPQFRSKGIGYLRLGDDMSQYGTAFLSLDAGNTYLDEGATSIVASGANTPSSYSNSYATSLRLSRTFGGFGSSSAGGIGTLDGGGTKTPLSATMRPRINRGLSFERALCGNDELENMHGNVSHCKDTLASGKASPRSPRPTLGVARTRGVGANGSRSPRPSQPSGNGAAPPSGFRRTGSSSSMKKQTPREDAKWESCLADLKECAHMVKNGDGMKWAERAGILQRLSSAIGEVMALNTVDSCISMNSNAFSEVITLIADSLGKQSNPHVLVASMGCLRSLECGSSLTTHCWLAWRAVLLEGVHSLRSANKLVSEAAMDTMMHLYRCRSISLATLCTGSLLEDLVVGVRSGAAGTGKKGINKPAAASSSSGSSKETANAVSSRTTASVNKVATAGNTARVLIWLNNVACIEKDELTRKFVQTSDDIDASCSGGSKLDTCAILKIATALLTHREEGTREAALALITTVLVIDALQCASHSLTGLLELSRRVSAGDGSRMKTDAAVQSNTESAVALAAIQASLSPGTLPCLEEIRALSARYCDRAVQGLAQSLSECALKLAVFSATTKSTPNAQEAMASDSAALSARTVSNDAVASGVSPRTTTVKILSPRTVPLLKAQNSQKTLNFEELTVSSSNASTPPYSYSVKRSASCEEATPTDTPRDGDSAMLSSQSHSSKIPAAVPAAGMTAVDVEKMQQGLQGIKSIRARSANRSTRSAVPDEASNTGDITATGVTSRGSSACRSRRRIMAASAAGAGLPSPEKYADSSASPAHNDQPYRTTPVDVLTPRRSPRPTLVSPRGLGSKNAVLVMPDALPSTAAPRPASASSLSQRLAQELGGMWYETKLLLRQVPVTAAEWDNTCQIVASAPQFFADLAELSARTHFPKGAILRYVLPFDEDTSSSDQASGRAVGAAVAGTPGALVGHTELLESLARRAVELRRIIRVKMADEADVSQASVATSMLHSFISRVETFATSTSLPVLQMLQRLDASS